MSNASDFWEDVGFELFVIFCWMALAGLLLCAIALFVWDTSAGIPCFAIGVVLIVPAMIHGVLLTIWHWKNRYRGKHSKLWGAILILETSGWFRLFYLLRHVIPDRRNRGRYLRPVVPQVAQPGIQKEGQ